MENITYCLENKLYRDIYKFSVEKDKYIDCQTFYQYSNDVKIMFSKTHLDFQFTIGLYSLKSISIEKQILFPF